jgi:YidC/Oxa1 family membrane protein insertase
MQPKTNTLNLILFAILSFAIIFGWQFLQIWLYPRQQPLPGEAAATCDLVFRDYGLIAAPGVPGLGDAARESTNQAIARYVAGRNYQLPKIVAQEMKKPPAVQEGRVAQERKVELKPRRPAQRKDDIWLGNDDFYIKVNLTSLGGGIKCLVLTQFKAADQMGRPVDGRMELLQEKLNRDDPSYRLYHYVDPTNDKEPLDFLGNIDWEVVPGSEVKNQDLHQIAFSHHVPGKDLHIEKIYTLRPGDYHIGLAVKIRRDQSPSRDPVPFRYQMTSGHGMRIEGEWYTTTYRNALVGWVNERNAVYRDFQDSRSIGMKDGGEQVLAGENQRILYAGTAVQFFASVIVVDDQQEKRDFLAWTRPTVQTMPVPSKPFLADITMRVVTRQFDLKPGDEIVHKYLLYNGPAKVRLLEDAGAGQTAVSPALVQRYIEVLRLDTLTDYHYQTGVPGWISEHIFSPIGWSYLLIKVTNLMHTVLFWLHSRSGLNYGICIIILTVLVRGLMHPVSRKQARTSMKMQALAPEMKKLQEKFKDDPQGKQRAMMELYRKHGVNPIGSCWVIFLQMPIFMGLYYALQESIHFRLADFLWIKNLAAPDMLFWWGESIPYISRPEDLGSSFLYLGPYFNLLPVLAVTLMIVQQKFLMPPPTDEQQVMQQKIMKYMMIFTGIFFYKVAAGLCVYFIASSLWGLAERKMLPKVKPATDASGASPPTGGKGESAGVPRPKPGPRPSRQRSPKPAAANGVFGRVREMWAELLEQAKKK